MTRREVVVPIGLIVVAVVALGLVNANRPPAIPTDLAVAPLGRTTATNGAGQACLPRAMTGDGWADVCWAVTKASPTVDGSAEQDYWQLRVFGSFQGVKWLVARADLVGEPNGGGYEGWPDQFAYEGSCRAVSAHA